MICRLYTLVALSVYFQVALSTTTILYDHRYVEELRLDPNNSVSRVGNVDVILDSNNNQVVAGICHIANFMGFSRVNGGCDEKQAKKIYKELAAILMAIHHFNTGDGRVVQELEGINEKCSIKLTAEFEDSEYTPNVVVQSLTRLLAGRDPLSRTNPLPCTVVGARTSSSTKPSSIVSGVYGIPQMSFTATSPELNDQFAYPLFQRVVPADDAASKAAMRFFTSVTVSTHIAILYIDDSFGNGYNKAFQTEAAVKGITTRSFPVSFPPNEDDIKVQIQNVKDTGYRHVFFVAFSSYIEPIMSEAARSGIAGDDYFWLLGISTSFFKDSTLPVDSDLVKAFSGMGVLPEFGAEPSSSGYQRFLKAWNELDEDDIEYFNSKVPSIRGVDDCFSAEPDFFSDRFHNNPGSTAHFAYDTIVSIGLGACNASADDGTFFDGPMHSQGIVGTSFDGASGIVQIDPSSTSRDPLLFDYAVWNVQPEPVPNGGNNVTFSTPETMVLRPNEARSGWAIQKNAPFIFADGTTTPPPSLPEYTVTMNYIGNLRIFGLLLCSIILALSAGFGIWTYRNRAVRVVRSSQPIFLYMICVGTFILGSMIIPLSYDDEHASRQQGLDIACMSQPWLASIGFIFAFSALSSKTWRINQLYYHAQRCQRLELRERDVLVPFFGLMAANTLVLLLWTFYAPLRFVRSNDAGTDQWNRVVSSTGRCVSETSNLGGAIPYLVALGAINLGAVILANVQAYKARIIHIEYSESRYIALAMMCLLQTWLTGIPVIALVYTIPRVYYVVLSLIVFLTCLAVLLTMFIPKIVFTNQWIDSQGDSNCGNMNPQQRSGSLHEEMMGDFTGAGLKVVRTRCLNGNNNPFDISGRTAPFDVSGRSIAGSERRVGFDSKIMETVSEQQPDFRCHGTSGSSELVDPDDPEEQDLSP